MTVEELLQRGKVLSQVSERFGEIPENQHKCIEACIHLTIANLYIMELAHHVSDGMDPYDAIIATANGELNLPESTASLIRLLAAKPKR